MSAEEQQVLLPVEPPTAIPQMIDIDSLPPDSQLVGGKPSRALVDSIRQVGLMSPLQVAMTPGRGGVRVIDGRRRLKAARLAGMTEVPIVLVSTTDLSVPALTVIHHSTRSENPAADLAAILEMIANGFSEAEIAEATRLSRQTIKKRLRLKLLVPALLAALDEGKISASVAEACCKLTADEQNALAETLANNKRLTLKDVKAIRQVGAHEAAASLPLDLFDTPSLEADDDGEPGDTIGERDALLEAVDKLLGDVSRTGALPDAHDMSILLALWRAWRGEGE